MQLTITVFLDEHNAVKLGDFGLSKILQSHDFASTYVGTPYYMSPEICAAERYSLYSDIWSLGCLLYELCAKEPPFNARTHIELFHKIKAGRVSPIPPVYSSELQKVITTCLQVNPNARPSTADLLNLPVVKLMRKEQEVVLFGQRMNKDKHALERRIRELEDRLRNVDETSIRAEIDAQVRREWEVKARLEIDKQVQAQTAHLKSLFESEVAKRVKEQVAAHNVPQRSSTPTGDNSELNAAKEVPLPLTDHESSDFPSQTDLSSLSLDSPTNVKQQPVKRSTRTPFARARTMFAGPVASPMDVQMADPSPMSIAGLSLSPRKNGKGPPNTKHKGNIFTVAEERWAPTNASTLPSPTLSEAEDSGADGEDEEDDGLPALPSPSRDPFKAAGKTKRPSLGRVKTLPANTRKLVTTPNLFNAPPANPNAAANARRPASAVPVVATSPTRKTYQNTSPTRPRAVVSKVPISSSNEGGSPRKEGMLKTAMTNRLQGRTLVELAQARTAPIHSNPAAEARDALKPTSKSDGAIKIAVGIAENEAPVWDPERDEMPSPFLVRGRGAITRTR
jgi:NIMA (never in mitosis gene a)-related kinase